MPFEVGQHITEPKPKPKKKKYIKPRPVSPSATVSSPKKLT